MEFREQITIGVVYFLFAYVATLGFWQLIATWQRLKALSWLGTAAKVRWGYLLGAFPICLACLWFFGTRSDEIFSPGPASSEFLFFLATALLCSLATTIFVSLCIAGFSPSAERHDEQPYLHKEPVSLERGKGILHIPSSCTAACPAICVVPQPGGETKSLETLAARLMAEGFVVLTSAVEFEGPWVYPDVLILLAKAIPYLGARDEVDSSRIGVMGVGLGGDLAIRAAASDREIRSVVAVGPLLVKSEVQPGLDLLREMSFPEAVAYTRLHRGGELVAQLAALEHIEELDAQPLLLIYGEEDGPAPLMELSVLQRVGKLKLIPGGRRLRVALDSEAISSSIRWFRESL